MCTATVCLAAALPGPPQDFHGEKELFSSDHLDGIEKSTVISKCHVSVCRGCWGVAPPA